MKARLPLLPTLLLTLTVLLAGQPLAFAQSGEDVLHRLKTKYDSITALRAEFTQSMESQFLDASESFSGTLILQGEKYRVETVAQTIVTDGRVTWIYNEDENQVLVNDYTEDETTFNINDFFQNYDTAYDIGASEKTTRGGEVHYELALTPKSRDSFFRTVTLWMRDRDNLITRVRVLDVNDIQMTFDLKDILLNPALSPETFLFTPPDGAEIVDLRS